MKSRYVATVKKGKGKKIGSSSESEEESESKTKKVRAKTKKVRAKMKKLRLCLLNPWDSSKKGGSSDSCAVGYAGINKIYNLLPPTTVA